MKQVRIDQKTSHPIHFLLCDGKGKAAVRGTMFQIVYDVKNKRIYYRNKSNRAIRFVDFKRFSFDCRKPVKILSIHKGEAGDTADLFKDYSEQANFFQLNKAVRETLILRDWPENKIKLRASYPSTLACETR